MAKTCCLCNEDKNLDQFYSAKGGLHGVRGECIECMNKKRAKKYDATEKPRRAAIKQEKRERLHKPCCRCHEDKKLNEFYRAKNAIDGRHSICIACFALHKATYYSAHKMKAMETAKAFQKANPEKKKAARAVQHEVDMGRMVKQPCEICGEKVVDAHHPSYEPENFLTVQWLCEKHHARANRMKTTPKIYTKELDDIWAGI